MRRTRRKNTMLVDARISRKELRQINRQRKTLEFIGGIIEFSRELRKAMRRNSNTIIKIACYFVIAVMDLELLYAFTRFEAAMIDKILFGALIVAFTVSGVKALNTALDIY